VLRRADFYHSCYCLAGLSLCQNVYFLRDGVIAYETIECLGEKSARIGVTHPVHNIKFESVERIKAYFK
jgi:prenyltransferase beta subunit